MRGHVRAFSALFLAKVPLSAGVVSCPPAQKRTDGTTIDRLRVEKQHVQGQLCRRKLRHITVQCLVRRQHGQTMQSVKQYLLPES